MPSTDGTINPLTGTQCLDPVDNTVKEILDQGDFGTGRHSTGSSQNQVYNMTDRRTGKVLSTDYILHFSYTDDTWVTNMAINQALVSAGFNIGGYAAEWQWKNENTNTINGACNATKVNGECLDDLVITVDVFASGINIYSEEWDYSQTKSNGYMLEEVLSFAPTALVPGVTIDEVEVTIRGKDNGYWQGMYGPKVQNLTGSLVLMPDLCVSNPLSDPNCPGYAQALYNQQCQANPLYDSGCPGYTTAMCTANPLYDPSCSGYQTAYFNQQCTNDPTSDPSCPDYYVAMCEEDSLFDPGCQGYDTAYFNQQCSLDPQYDTTCPGYVDLSGNDGEFTVLSPIIDDVVNADPIEPEIYESPVETLPQEEFVVEQEQAEADSGFQIVEDDIDEELGELEMVDDIDAELAKLEEESVSKADGGEAGVGNTNQEDDIEKELAELEKAKPMDEQPIPGKTKPIDPEESRRDKMRLLIGLKAIEAVKELDAAVTLEQQMDIQRRLLALISFVPDFKTYAEKEQINQINFYPPKPTVDHAFARWFLNDPNFGAMEDLQYQ